MVDELHEHLSARYGITIDAILTLAPDVLYLRRRDGPNWVARVFPERRPVSAVEGDAEILRELEELGYPAERCADPHPVSILEGRPVLVTEAVSAARGAARRAAIKDAGGIRGLGALLGRLHTLEVSGNDAFSRPGGAWHHMAEGRPVDELAAARDWFESAVSDRALRPDDRRHIDALRAALERVDDCEGLPEAFIHPDFVLANVVATPEPAMVLVDWAGAGLGPRLWSLAFLLWAEGNKDLRRVELAVAGYRSVVQPEPEELDRLRGAIAARSLVFGIWRLHHHGGGFADAAAGADQAWELAGAIAERARAAFARGPAGTARAPSA